MANVPLDLADWMRRIEDELRTVAGRAQTRPPQSQAVSGDVVVGAARALRVLLASGVGDQFLLGQDGGQRVARLYRTDGTIALSVATASAAPQGVTIWDLLGNPVVQDDTGASGGLARPYIPMVVAAARATDWLATTNASFEDVWRMTPLKINPRATVTVGHIADASTAGELRVTVAGTPFGSATVVGTSQTSTTIGPFDLPGAPEAAVDIRVQARRTSGAGNVRCAVLAATGFHS